MKRSDWFSLQGCSENTVIDARNLVMPQLYSIQNMYIGHHLAAPTWANISYTPADYPGNPPCVITPTYASWIVLGPYCVALNAEGVNGEIYWSAPNRPGVWDKTELDGGGNTIKTGAGEAQLKNNPQIINGLAIGALAPIFCATEIGILSLTDMWVNPFSYNIITTGLQADTNPLEADRHCFFMGSDGFFYRITGSQLSLASDSFDATQARGNWTFASAPTTPRNIGLNGMNFVIAMDSTAGAGNARQIWVHKRHGGYSHFKGTYATSTFTPDYSGTVPSFTTGVLPLVEARRRVHLMAIRLRGISYTVGAGSFGIKATTSSYVDSATDSETVSVTNTVEGAYETTIAINRMLTEPQVKISFPTRDTAGWINVTGMQFIFEDGGPAEY